MVTRAAASLALAALLGGDRPPAEGLAGLARHWPDRVLIEGSKSEPTYQETIHLLRDGGRLSVAIAPAGQEASITSASLASGAPGASGFLASATLWARLRERRAVMASAPVTYGARRVICVAAEQLSVSGPILDPCFDSETGLALAFRHRASGRFEGPSLDPETIRVIPLANEDLVP